MKLVELQYQRNDNNFIRGTFRNRGDLIEIFPAHLDDRAWRISFFSDTVEEIHEFDPLTGKIYSNYEEINIFPNSHYVTPKPSLEKAIKAIKEELIDRIDYFIKNKKLIEAQRPCQDPGRMRLAAHVVGRFQPARPNTSSAESGRSEQESRRIPLPKP